MDQSYQLYLFILSTTLFTDIKPLNNFTYNWYEAQNHCLGHGLTIERNKSDQPYWTGLYRRRTPWMNMLGCYPDSINLLQDVVKKTMIKGSIGMCQEICYHEQSYKFAVKMNECLCIKNNTHESPFDRLPASDCNFKCRDNSDDIYSGECGGKRAYNVYEIQGVYFNSREACLSLQCSSGETQFIPKKCSENFAKVCENMTWPDNEYARSWSLSMEQCKISQKSTYLLGDIDLTNPLLVCSSIPRELEVLWIGVARQIYTSIDEGQEIREEQIGKFLECQICERNYCHFMDCFNSLNGYIFCKRTSIISQAQITKHFTTSQENVSASTSLSAHSTAEELFISTSTARNYDTDQVSSTNDTQQMPSASEDLVLKITLPLTLGFTILSISAVGALYCTRRFKATKADRITKTKVESGPQKNVDFSVDCVQNNSYFVLEQCPQYISKGSYSSNESPYNNSEEGVYDHLRDKNSRKPEVEDTYQHASNVSRDMSEYDTMANAVNQKQEENASYDYSHQNTNEKYGSDLRANNVLTDNPYDVAV